MLDNLSPQHMVEKFQAVTSELMVSTFPVKKIIISTDDKPWFNEELRKLKRLRLREYGRNGRSSKYLKIVSSFDLKSKTEIAKYIQKVKLEVIEGKRGSSYPAIKRLGLKPGDQTQSQSVFQLPAHADLRLSSAESAELIAEHFSKISQEYSPLDVAKLPSNVQIYLKSNDSNLAPRLSAVDVRRRIIKAKKPNGIIPGDLPKKVVQNCSEMLAPPIAKIFNKITVTAEYPPQWKIEHQVALAKVYPPESEEELRNIAKTPFWSKVYESFVGEWILEIIKPFLDPGQCGMKGLSTTHYLIKLLQFVHATLDLKQPHAVLAACVDLSKAFNRVDHSLVIQDLYDMHTPAWLLKIMISYLSDRSMYLSYNGAKSSLKVVPAGGPQGAYLGGIVFIIKYISIFETPCAKTYPGPCD